jgi:hypothetical protein
MVTEPKRVKRYSSHNDTFLFLPHFPFVLESTLVYCLAFTPSSIRISLDIDGSATDDTHGHYPHLRKTG